MNLENQKKKKEDYLKQTEYFRNRADIHFNCAQAVIITYAEECGISQEKACQLGAHFGSGMKMGGCCGAITGGLMVIGMMGGGDEQYRIFMDSMRKKHDNLVNCADLLRKNAELGNDKKTHCDNMVYDAVEGVFEAMNLSF